MAITKGKIEAKVSGSEIYNLRIQVKTLPPKKWNAVKRRCGGQIGSLIELLQGRLSDNVMEVVTDRKNGLFPLPGEISLHCNCPDWAVMCKHVAAVLYGVGARLDEKPELLFKLRGVDHEELIEADAEAAVSAVTTGGRSKRLDVDDLSDVFGVDISASSTSRSLQESPRRKAKKKPAARGTANEGVAQRAAKKSGKKKARKESTRKPAKKKAVGKSAAAKKQSKPARKRRTAKKVPKRAAKKKRTTKMAKWVRKSSSL